jgi:small subunit ribosomal protein S14
MRFSSVLGCRFEIRGSLESIGLSGEQGVLLAKKALIVKAQRKQRFAVREYNRCRVCGRSRAYMRKFGMCRICFREHALKGLIPGVIKSSW